jgi:hypothetical protein
MTLYDQAVALSLVPDLSRLDLGHRLRSDDPMVCLSGRPASPAVRAAGAGIEVLPWNDLRFPVPVLAIPDLPPAL